MIKKIAKWILILFLMVAIVLGSFFYYLKYLIAETPLEISPPGYVLLVTPGMPVQKMAELLEKEGVLQNPTLFVWWIYLTGVSGQLKAGEYLIKEGSTAEDLVNLLISGKVIQHSFTIIEGWNFETLLQAVNETAEFNHSLQGLKPEEVMTKLGHTGEHPEGRFFPDTYYFPLGTTDLAFLQRAYKTMQDKLNNAWEKRGKSLAVETPYQALILASIIEKESNLCEEYGEISGVFHRRLLRGMPLQADPTVIYGAGRAYTGTITKELLKLPNPYNTYLNNGLPPTPIAMPSERSLLAATKPREGSSLYFVARGKEKGHIFSKTLSEHQAAVNRYRQVIQNSNGQQAQMQPQNQAETNQAFQSRQAVPRMAIQLQGLQLEVDAGAGELNQDQNQDQNRGLNQEFNRDLISQWQTFQLKPIDQQQLKLVSDGFLKGLAQTGFSYIYTENKKDNKITSNLPFIPLTKLEAIDFIDPILNFNSNLSITPSFEIKAENLLFSLGLSYVY